MTRYEKKLLLQIAAGDEKAFARFYYDTSPSVLHTIYSLVKVQQVAEDILQEVYIKAWLHRMDMVVIGYPIAWLKKIASNAAINHLRRQTIEYNWLKEISRPTLPSGHVQENDAIAKELRETIQKAVSLLGDQQQKVYHLSRENGFSRQEIALAMGLSENTVRNHLHLALRHIRNFVQNRGLLLLLFLFANIFSFSLVQALH